MGLKFKVDDTNPSELTHRLNCAFDNLANLGVRIRQDSNQDIIVECYSEIPGWSILQRCLGRRRDDRCFVLEKFFAITPFTAYHLALLVQYYEEVAFLQGLDQLSIRIADLGWTVEEASSHKILESDKSYSCTTIDRGTGTSEKFYWNTSELFRLQELVTREELYRELREHAAEFRQAGIVVMPGGIDKIQIILQEGDPVLTRYLTAENVQRIIALARAWNELQ